METLPAQNFHSIQPSLTLQLSRQETNQYNVLSFKIQTLMTACYTMSNTVQITVFSSNIMHFYKDSL